MEIRPATIDDALAIATVYVRSWQAAYRGLLPQSYLDDMDPERRLGQWQESLEATAWPLTGTLVLVETAAESSTGVATIGGFARVSPSRDDDAPPLVGELQTLYLDPGFWHKGAGSALLAAAHSQLVRAGFHAASAWVLETNTRARSFYERHDWAFDGTTKPHDWGTFVVTDVRYRVALA
jgi:ribosomal protein S18 acetylase RimI-like enzyme